MTIEQVEKIVGQKLDYNSYTSRKIYGGDVLYFYLRELKQDHYFTIKDRRPVLYLLKHNKRNYDPSFTTTGKDSDSFMIDFNAALAEGNIVEVQTGEIGKEEFQEHVAESTSYLDRDTLVAKIDNIIIELTELKVQLKK